MIDVEEAAERMNIANAKWTYLHDGKLLPVTNLIDSSGNETRNPMRAVAIVVFDESQPAPWLSISVDPGEVWSRS